MFLDTLFFQLTTARSYKKLACRLSDKKISQKDLFSHDEIEVMADFIPNFAHLFLTAKANTMLVKDSLSSSEKEYLNNLTLSNNEIILLDEHPYLCEWLIQKVISLGTLRSQSLHHLYEEVYAERLIAC